ncbi:MAG: hypothetical protein ABIK26_08890 [Candidatus Omnitrophota bacterium]
MKKALLFIILCLIIVNTTGCATMINKKMDSWMGHNVNDLIASWGPPQQTMSDGQGGQIFVYSSAVQWTTPGRAVTNTRGSANTYGNLNANTYGRNTYGTYSGNTYGSATSTTTYTPPKTQGWQRQRLFWADSNGNLYRWSWKGL